MVTMVENFLPDVKSAKFKHVVTHGPSPSVSNMLFLFCPDHNIHTPVFGQPLDDHLRRVNRDIAIVLEECCCALLNIGLEEEVRITVKQ